jgi:hypothetical protein
VPLLARLRILPIYASTVTSVVINLWLTDALRVEQLRLSLFGCSENGSTSTFQSHQKNSAEASIHPKKDSGLKLSWRSAEIVRKTQKLPISETVAVSEFRRLIPHAILLDLIL